MTFENFYRIETSRDGARPRRHCLCSNFSKVNSLLNLLNEIAVEPTFEKFFYVISLLNLLDEITTEHTFEKFHGMGHVREQIVSDKISRRVILLFNLLHKNTMELTFENGTGHVREETTAFFWCLRFI